MIETILLALLIARIRGYNIKLLFKVWVIYPILICEIIYIFLQLSVFVGNYRFIEYASILKHVYLFLFLFPVIKYKMYFNAIFGSIFIFAGTALNNIVIKLNNGSMPVFPSLSYRTGYVKEYSFNKINDIHILGSSSTKLKFLSDTIDIGYSILSIGDVFIRGFAFIIIFNLIKYLNKEKHGQLLTESNADLG